jgi:hypothetical protein
LQAAVSVEIQNAVEIAGSWIRCARQIENQLGFPYSASERVGAHSLVWYAGVLNRTASQDYGGQVTAYDNDVAPQFNQSIDQVAADESRTTKNNNRYHAVFLLATRRFPTITLEGSRAATPQGRVNRLLNPGRYVSRKPLLLKYVR